MDPTKTDQVARCAIPSDKSQIRQFLWLASYDRRHIEDYAAVAGALYELTKENVHFKWSFAAHLTFEQIKRRLCTALILAYPIPGKPFMELYCRSWVEMNRNGLLPMRLGG